jgi:B12-binding domain/radical SAM domain protein
MPPRIGDGTREGYAAAFLVLPPTVVAYHVRSGIAALNVVTAALPDDVPVVFVRTREEMAAALGAAPRAVGAWSFYSPDFARAAEDLAWVKARAAGGGVVHLAGGVHATAEPLATLRAGFDVACVGEGETTFRELVAAWARGDDLRGLRGTASLDGRGELVRGAPGERRPLDEFPPFNVRYGKWNAIEITRGCVYACAFCQTPYMFKARFRHRSVDNVRAHVAEMVRSDEARARFVRFVTPTCLSYGSPDERVDLAAVEALLAAVRAEVGREGKIYFGTFPSECRPEHVTTEALEVLARYVDNDSLVIGGQSGSERVLEATRRGHGVDDVVRAVECALGAGFRPDVDFLLGIPGETKEDRAASIALAERLVAMGARIHTHAFMPLPGTPLRDAEPAPIEPETARALGALAARQQAYGQWQRQIVTAQELVRARRAARVTPDGVHHGRSG